LIHQQQHSGAQAEHPLPLPLPLQQQLQQQQLTSPVLQQHQQQLEPQRTGSSIAHRLMQPVRQLSLPVGATGCCCCMGGGGCRSALPSAQPDMTEACTVARVAGHLELEVMSTTTGGHNHGHFQVFLSQRPLSFATSLLLACALCIHSILEGLALGAQQSMQVRWGGL
jgi:zinc transporter ZupT